METLKAKETLKNKVIGSMAVSKFEYIMKLTNYIKLEWDQASLLRQASVAWALSLSEIGEWELLTTSKACIKMATDQDKGISCHRVVLNRVNNFHSVWLS